MKELEDISQHLHDRISSLRRVLDLSVAELPQNKIKKLGQELHVLGELLEEFEKCVDQQKEQLGHLKELEASFQSNLEEVQHMRDNIPSHMPRKKSPANEIEAVVSQKAEADTQVVPPQHGKKTNKSYVREMDIITMPEFESIPQYMKGRVSYDLLNAAVQSINTAVAAKYKIVHQSVKTLNSHSRKLYQRFKEQETKDTKLPQTRVKVSLSKTLNHSLAAPGQFFVVEDDIREFTQMKVDKRFQGILNMLRHCQRLRELRGGGLTRYMLL